MSTKKQGLRHNGIRVLYDNIYFAQSVVADLGELDKAVRLLMASPHSQPMCSENAQY